MSGDVLVTLAQFAGQTVAAAAITDCWNRCEGGSRDCLAGGCPEDRSRKVGWRRRTTCWRLRPRDS